MGKRAKEKKSSRQRPRDNIQTVDAGEEQPDTRRKPRNGHGKNNRQKHKTRHVHHHEETDEDANLTKSLAEHNLEILEMSPDGNCLFRALSDQLYGDYGNDHANIRAEICDFMESNKTDFKDFLVVEDDSDQQEEDARDVEHYIEQMREDGKWGADIEIMAAARLYRRNVWVYSADLAAYSFDHGGSKSIGPDLLVSFHGHENHYNSVRSKGSPPKRVDVNLHSQVNDKERESSPARETNDPCSGETSDLDPPGMRVQRTKSRHQRELLEESVQNNTSTADKSIKKNDPCPCDSGLRYKKCCLPKQKLAARQQRERIKSTLEGHEGETETSESPAQQNSTSFQTVTI